MDYAEWIRSQHQRGVPASQIAEAALHGPAVRFSDISEAGELLNQVAALLQVSPQTVHVVGSARFGFCLRDGSPFDPAYSDLDLAVVDAHLYARCSAGPPRRGAARFPENDLPHSERVRIRAAFDDLSRTFSLQFAYISVAVFQDRASLVNALIWRVRAHLGITEPAVDPSSDSSVQQPRIEPDFLSVAATGFPRYTEAISDSTPFNASPWLTDMHGLRTALGGSALRDLRLNALEQALIELEQVVEVQCSLIGGSFLDGANPSPNDLDIVLFYKAHPVVRMEPGRALQRLTRKFLLSRIDMRCVPCDAQPWLTVKLTSYFTMLYQSSRSDTTDKQSGMVLLVPGSDSFQRCR